MLNHIQISRDLAPMLRKVTFKAPVTQMCDDFLGFGDTSLHFTSGLYVMCKNVKYFFETLFCLSKNSRTFRKNGSRGLKTSVKGRDTLPKIIPRPDFAILRIFTTLSIAYEIRKIGKKLSKIQVHESIATFQKHFQLLKPVFF